MITTLSMNPSIDLTLFIPAFCPGESHRARSRRDISGKAVNTSYALVNLGMPTKLLGFDFTENGSLLKESLQAAGVTYDMFPVEGAIRTNVKIFEEEKKLMTEINQEGDMVPEEAVRALLEMVRAAETDVLILSGSLPQGVDSGVYGEIIKGTKARVILDAYGPALSKGFKENSGPYLIKPNLKELEQTFGEELPTRSAQIKKCRQLLKNSDQLTAVCLSLGSEGALMVGEDEAYFAPVLDIPVRGVQGAGDAMVAGLAMEMLNNAPLAKMLKSAMAAAAASLIREGTLMATREGFEEMFKMVELVEV